MHLQMPPGSDGFWKWELDEEIGPGGYRAVLDVDEVVRNTIANMRRMEEQVTTRVVIDFLRSKGYIIIEPEEAEDG